MTRALITWRTPYTEDIKSQLGGSLIIKITGRSSFQLKKVLKQNEERLEIGRQP